MLKELMSKTYQNFYINEYNTIVGIVSPREIWKITKPQELKQYYINTISRCKEQIKAMGNYEPLKAKLEKCEKMLKKLDNTMTKLAKQEA